MIFLNINLQQDSGLNGRLKDGKSFCNNVKEKVDSHGTCHLITGVKSYLPGLVLGCLGDQHCSVQKQ